MLIPIRCFTCGKVIADKYLVYQEKLKELDQEDANAKIIETKIDQEYEKNKDLKIVTKSHPLNANTNAKYFYGNVPTGKILDELGLTRYCCRRHLITNVDMMEII